MSSTKETHVSEAKKQKVKELAEQMKRKTVMVISIKSLPSAQFQDIKKKLRNKVKIQVVKKSLAKLSLDCSDIKELKDLVPYVNDSTAMLFSDDDAFVISGILADEKSPAKAKAGQIAPSDIEVKAGPTELIPGPDISALSAVGLMPKVENGKIAVMQDKIIVKKGKEITEALASIMAKLDIIPFEVGIKPIAAFMDGKVYADIEIDKENIIAIFENDFGQAIAFAVELGIMNSETLDIILNKVGIEGNVVDEIVDEEELRIQNLELSEGGKEEEKKETPVEKVEEDKAEEKKETDSGEKVEKEVSVESVEEESKKNTGEVSMEEKKNV